MLEKLRARFSRPTPTTVIALVALFVALGGTGYAALKLPKNSVGTKQLKNNAVTGAKVKNGSLSVGDFGGTLPTGATGPKGDTGAKGDKGDTGAKGDPGAKGDKGDKGDAGNNGNNGSQGPTGAAGANGAALVASARCLNAAGCPVPSTGNTLIPLAGDTTWTQATGDAAQVDIHLEWQPASSCTGGTGSQVTIEDNTVPIATFATFPTPNGQNIDKVVHLFPPSGTSHVLTAHVADDCNGGGAAEQGTVGQLRIDVALFVAP
jgi:hypothetical protein